MAWSGVEAALHACITSCVNNVAIPVIIAAQNGPRPAKPFVVLTLGHDQPVGARDEVVRTHDAGAPLGEEIVETVRGLREFEVTVTVYGATTGSGSVRNLASGIRLMLSDRGIRATLKTAGVSIFDVGDITPIHTVLDADWEGRARLDLRCYTYETRASSVGYITSVTLTDSETDEEIDVP